MKTKEFVQLFVPPIYYKVKKRLFPRPEPERHPLPRLEEKGDRLIIIGNGPSLNKSIELYGDVIKQSECLMVNHSASTDLFEYLRPSFYLLVDPAWIYPENSTHTEAIYRTINAIVSKTIWPMTIVMPRTAINGYANNQFKKNKNINVMFFEDCQIMPKDMTKFEAWDKNMVCPPGQTVMNTAVWLPIYWEYKETYIIGADTSFVADLHVDQETNIVYSIDTHFYSNDQLPVDDYDEKNHRRTFGTKLHEEYFTAGIALRDYWAMREYADWKGVKVYNACEFSWIDAFERKKLK